VLVVSDRTVLDDQLQEAIFDFQRTTGVVATITDEHGSKSAQLSQALKDGKKIIVCTIQTFPFALKAVQELAATEGKRFAVIADEAHSSQTGEAAAKLKQVLSADELAELQDGGEIDTEALLAAQMSAKAAQDKGSPTSPSPRRPSRRRWSSSAARTPTACPALPCVFDAPGDRGGFHPRRAEELHDLQARLQAGQQRQGVRREEVEKSEAQKEIMQWVRLHPYNISQKVQVVVEHFRDNVQPLLGGRAKAMIVVGSRREAVRWQKAITGYIQKRNYPLACWWLLGRDRRPESYPEPVRRPARR
jgi:type I restriction enzyme R subunit